jgi:hypothetical protein
MKRVMQGIGLGATIMLLLFSGCKPSEAELQARATALRQACETQLSAAAEAKDFPALKSAIENADAKLTSDVASSLVQQTLDRMISSGDYDGVEKTLAYVMSTAKLKAFHAMSTAIMLKNRLAAQRWGGIPVAIEACVTALPDAPCASLLRQSFDAMKQSQQLELLEKTSQKVYRMAANKPAVLSVATVTWVDAGIAKDKSRLPSYLETLLEDQVSPVQVGALFDRYFYSMISQHEIVKQLCAVGAKILAVCKDTPTLHSVKLKMLDGAFITENYDLVIEMLEQGIPGKDKEWHATTLPKVKAHRALAQNKPLEAIAHFRQFMTAWKQSKQTEESDPSSNLIYSREWILGRNAVRIAKLYGSLPDAENQKKTLVEADGYFKEALTKVAKDSAEFKALTQEIKDAGL